VNSASTSIPLLLLSTLCCLAGCPSAGGSRTGAAGARDAVRAHRAGGELATHYGASGPAELDELEARVMATLTRAADQAGRSAPQADRAAQLAARDICRALPAQGPPPSTVVEFALRSYGLVDPPPHMVIAGMPPGLEKEVLEQLGSRFRQILGNKPFSRVGIGITTPAGSPAYRRVLVALLEHRIEFEPLPRRMTLGQRVTLRFKPAPSHHSVHLVVTTPAGKTEKGPASGGRMMTGQLTCGERGIYQVEVTGVGGYGPEVLANFPVYCDKDPPTEVRVGEVKRLADDDRAIEAELLEGTNAIRRRAKLKPLVTNARLTEVARRHSQDMRDNGFVGHVSPTTGRPTDRLQAAKVLHLVVRENVAQAYSTEEALRELMGSPAHRENILATDVTQLGIGVAVDRSGTTPFMLVTQLFMKPGKAYDPRTAMADVLAAIRRSRSRTGLPPLKPDDQLSRLAGNYVRNLLAGADRKAEADATLAQALRQLGGRFTRVDGLHVRVSVIDALEQAEELSRKRYTHLGIGVGRSGEQVVIFLLLAGSK